MPLLMLQFFPLFVIQFFFSFFFFFFFFGGGGGRWWSGGAMVLFKLPVPGRPTTLDKSRVGWLVVFGLTAL